MRALTMADEGFLPQLIVLARSLDATSPDAQLEVLALDEAATRALRALRLPNVAVLELRELEASDSDLAAIRKTRSWREYCWTCAPALCARAVARATERDVVAWLDADIEVYAAPAAFLNSLGDASVLLVPHRYGRPYPSAAPGAYLARTYGPYNGGTVLFRSDAAGRRAAELWRERTLAWCRGKPDSGRFGNQLHLRDLPTRVPAVRVARDPGVGLGPWNGFDKEWARTSGAVRADGRPAAFYHFQSLRLWRAGALPALPSNVLRMPGGRGLVARTTAWYRIAPSEREVVWRPYLRRLATAIDELAEIGHDHVATLPRLGPRELLHDAYHVARLNKDRLTWRVLPERPRKVLRRRRRAIVGAFLAPRAEHETSRP